jgi:hypothetical protein
MLINLFHSSVVEESKFERGKGFCLFLKPMQGKPTTKYEMDLRSLDMQQSRDKADGGCSLSGL